MKAADLVRHRYLYHCRIHKLTKWERKFVKDTVGKRMMPKQIDKLREIYNNQRRLEQLYD